MDVNTTENIQYDNQNSLKASQIVILEKNNKNPHEENLVKSQVVNPSSRTTQANPLSKSEIIKTTNNQRTEEPKINERILEGNKHDDAYRSNNPYDGNENKGNGPNGRDNPVVVKNQNNGSNLYNENINDRIAADLNKPYAMSNDPALNQANHNNSKVKQFRSKIKKSTCGKCLVF